MNKLISYEDFRTGLTFREVYFMIWSYSEDSRKWPKTKSQAKPCKRNPEKKTAGRRHTVLGKWRQIKLGMYEEYLAFNTPPVSEYGELEIPF